MYVDVLAHPDSLQWKGYSLTYANGRTPYTVCVAVSSCIHSLPPIAWVPSVADTDPQMFCKRFQLYLSNLDYVCVVEGFIL